MDVLLCYTPIVFMQVVRRYPPFIKAMKKRGIDEAKVRAWHVRSCVLLCDNHHPLLFLRLCYRFVLILGARATSTRLMTLRSVLLGACPA